LLVAIHIEKPDGGLHEFGFVPLALQDEQGATLSDLAR
jgi:hypothetical protein